MQQYFTEKSLHVTLSYQSYSQMSRFMAVLRYFVPQVQITGKMLNGYLMFSVKNIVQNVKLIELWGKNLAPLHFVISKS